MFIAMNRFKITKGFEAGFEEVWRQRDSYLHTVQVLSLLKGGEFDDHTLYASHTIWESKQALKYPDAFRSGESAMGHPQNFLKG